MGRVSIAKPEFFFAGIVPAVVDGYLVNVFRSHKVIRIIQIDFLDGAGIGIYGDMVIRHTLRYPYGACFSFAGAYDLEVPYLIFVGDGERFAVIVPAVFCKQITGHTDGVAGGCISFQHQLAQALTVDQSAVALQFFPAAESGLADSQLFGVQARVCRIDVSVGFFHLGNLADLNVGIGRHGQRVVFYSFVHGNGLAGLVFLCRDNVDP